MDVARELRLSQFAPAAEELRFAPGGPLPPIEYRAKTGSGLLTGQIDRVDTYEADGRRYFRIIDYKTGHKDFDYAELLYGKNLQMLLYLFALESYQRRAGTPMQPAGVLYVPGRCDMVKLKPGEDPAQADAERQKDLRRKGCF
ncbi:MAG: PD-(D/E)XK nuclease family protein [Acutalibacteraceae bacterium]